MAEDQDEKEGLPPQAPTLVYVRTATGVKRKELASRLGHANDTTLGKVERGETTPTRDTLVGYVEPTGAPPEAVDALLAVHPLVLHLPPETPSSPVALTREELAPIDRVCLGAASSLLPDFRATLIREKEGSKAEAARQEARQRWEDFKNRSWQERRTLVETWPRYRTWFLAEHACKLSIKAAHHRAADALELARFALFIAERLPEAAWRPRAEALCWGHVGNAQRVGEDFDAADRSFVRAWHLWNAGAGADPDLFPEWQLYSLEASLRRAQHRFPEALERIDRAWERSRGNTLATGRILLQKSNVLEQIGDLEGALAVLDEAAPLVEELEDTELRFALRFNRVDDLARLERHKEAARLLPEVRKMAIEQGNGLSLTRVAWLDAKIRAGLGDKEEAMKRLEKVCDDFTARRHPYDAGLTALDLAELKLEAGLRSEVRGLAARLVWIFTEKKVHEKALAALRLFYNAAMQDLATVELIRQVIAAIERVRPSAPPSGD